MFIQELSLSLLVNTNNPNWADIFSDGRKKIPESMPTTLPIFCGIAPVHTFMIFLTKNSNSKNKILCGRPQNLVWAQIWEKIIRN